MTDIKRTYNVPLRREYLKVPRYKRSKKAITALKEFLIRHMKSEDISISEELNEFIWRHGIKNPPHHVKIDVLKDKDNKVFAQLEGLEIKTNKEEEKKEKKKEETKTEKPSKKETEEKTENKK